MIIHTIIDPYALRHDGGNSPTANIDWGGFDLTNVGAFAPTSIGAFTLTGKLTAGASEIEGSNFDINGGTVDAITSLTVANNVDIGPYNFEADRFIAGLSGGGGPTDVVFSLGGASNPEGTGMYLSGATGFGLASNDVTVASSSSTLWTFGINASLGNNDLSNVGTLEIDDGTHTPITIDTPTTGTATTRIGNSSAAVASFNLLNDAGAVAIFRNDSGGGGDHLEIINGAGFSAYFFEDSVEGENKYIRIYGFPTDETLKFGQFRIIQLDSNPYFRITTDGTGINIDTLFRVGDGTTNYAEFSTTGDMTFVGSAGLPFGSFWGNEIAFVAAGGTGTFFEISDSDITVGQTNLTTFQNNKELAVTNAGMYKVDWSMSVKATGANKHLVGGIGVDAGGSGALAIQNDGRNHSVSTGNAEFGIGGTAILDLTASSEVGLMATNETDNTNVTVEHVSLAIVMVGGT